MTLLQGSSHLTKHQLVKPIFDRLPVFDQRILHGAGKMLLAPNSETKNHENTKFDMRVSVHKIVLENLVLS